MSNYTISKEIYPFEGKYIDLTDLRLHYLDEGSGDPVVMLHGNPTWSIYYRNLVKALRGEYRCIVPDHIGCGFSDKPDDANYDYTLEQRVDDLEMLLQYLKIDKNITLIVHDWGGMIGMAYATRHPESIKKIVLLNTAAFHLPPGKKFPLQLRLFRNTELGGAMVRHFNAFAVSASIFCCSRKLMSRELRDAYCSPYDSWDNRIATLRFIQDIPLNEGDKSYDLVTEVQNKLNLFEKTPVLICWGEKDFIFDKDFLNEWLRYFPHAEVHRFADCGHYVLEDAPEEITKYIKEFLKAITVKKIEI